MEEVCPLIAEENPIQTDNLGGMLLKEPDRITTAELVEGALADSQVERLGNLGEMRMAHLLRSLFQGHGQT